MIKRAVTFVVIFLIVSTLIQWLFKSEIRWTENAGIAIFAFFIFIVVDRLTASRKRKKNAR